MAALMSGTATFTWAAWRTPRGRSLRPSERQLEWWAEAQTEVRARLARIDREESRAPAQMVPSLRVVVASEVRR